MSTLPPFAHVTARSCNAAEFRVLCISFLRNHFVSRGSAASASLCLAHPCTIEVTGQLMMRACTQPRPVLKLPHAFLHTSPANMAQWGDDPGLRGAGSWWAEGWRGVASSTWAEGGGAYTSPADAWWWQTPWAATAGWGPKWAGAWAAPCCWAAQLVRRGRPQRRACRRWCRRR